MKENYLPKDQRKNMLLICDDIRFSSGVATQAKEIVLGTAHNINWVQIAVGLNHPDAGRILDLSKACDSENGLEDSSVILLPTSGYSDKALILEAIKRHNIDGVLLFTDPRYFIEIFQISDELRSRIPLIYYNIWDNSFCPMYNFPYYNSCDALFSISKQTKIINYQVLGEKSEEKLIKYIPHGVNPKNYYPVDKDNSDLTNFKRRIFGDKEYDFVILWNSRNMPRKKPSDMLMSYKLFCDLIGFEGKKICLIMHTNPVDSNGTNLLKVKDDILGKDYNVIFSTNQYSTKDMNLLYNSCDIVCSISSQEGFGLSLLEGINTGKMVVANATGGMKDQMKVTDMNGNDIFTNNPFLVSTIKHGEWSVPVMPRVRTLIGSMPTPYLYEDIADVRDFAMGMKIAYDLGEEERNRRGLKGREWILSEESMMNSQMMCDNFINGFNELFETWKPIKKYSIEKL